MIQITKSILMFATSLYFFLVFIGNFFDYYSNFEFVKHVLSMDTTFKNNNMMWRSIESPFIHHVFYITIILWELIAAIMSFISGIKLYQNRKNKNLFIKSIKFASTSCIIGMLLWLVAFITIGGEWFLMWQSDSWNGLDPAFRMFTIQGIILMYINVGKDDFNIS